ncbi:MAG TPA: TraM recognition domain-containing protein, partial [Acidimicrobiales bacterium]|nr:TraM recognition domain-containing protein [Acidimicrobiales bacterium]
AEALLAPLFHAAALVGADVGEVVRWVLRHDPVEAQAVLTARGATLAADVLAGIAATDGREQSGIWSTAAGVLAAYRSTAATEAARRPNFDPAQLCAGHDTVYVCAPGDRQELVAPVVVGLLERARAGAYLAAAAPPGAAASPPPAGAPLWMVLDEVANVAPLPDLPALVSEGGGQGVTTVACLQDLSQARHRWGPRADGFASLFSTKVVLPGIGDPATLELISRLGGEIDVPVHSTSRGPWYGRDWGAPSATVSTRRQRRIPFEAVSQLPPGTGLVVRGAEPPVLAGLPPFWQLTRQPAPDPPAPSPPTSPAPTPGKAPPAPGVGL